MSHKEVIDLLRQRIANLPTEQLHDAYELLGCLLATKDQYNREVIAGTIQEILFPERILGQKSLQSDQ